MKLSELTPELFRKALDLYVERAYPDGKLPARARVDTSKLKTAEDVLDLFTRERRPNPGGTEVRHFVVRLGNQRYPHMKLALMEFLEPDEFIWAVDTHDRTAVEPGSPDWDAWQDLRIHNLKMKARIETAWRKAGIPTARVVARKMRAVAERGDGPLVLVVDDEQGLRAGAAKILRNEGYRVVEAESGLEAIDRFLVDHPDLVVVDYEMPGMNGEDVVRRLRDIETCAESTRRTPVLLATAGMVPLAERCSADGFLVKPYQRTLLLSFVRHQLPGDKR
jgi:CheY-like chemotaxis protein